MSSNIRAMIADVEVESLEAAIPFYRELAGDVEVRRFPYRDLELALVGPFLLYSGPLENYVSQTATIIVDALEPVLEALSKAGAEVLEAPNEVSNGTRMVARHPDGSVFEYMQLRKLVHVTAAPGPWPGGHAPTGRQLPRGKPSAPADRPQDHGADQRRYRATRQR